MWIKVWVNHNEYLDKRKCSSETLDDLSEKEKRNYEIKQELINSEGFVEMRILTKEELLIKELVSREYPKERIDGILKVLKEIGGDRNKIINKLLMKIVLLPKIEKTYIEFRKKWGSLETKKILNECYENGFKCITDHIKCFSYEGFNLRKCSKMARWEYFLFVTNENKNKYIMLEIQKNNKDTGIDVLNNEWFFIRIHFDEDTDITKMSDVLLKWKKLLDTYFVDKKIKYAILSSRLFDDEFNDFRIRERIKEWKTTTPNRIKIREERLKYYWCKLASQEPSLDDPIEDNFVFWEDNSMMRAIKKYKSEWKTLKEWWWYIDLEKLEKWKFGQSNNK